MELGSLRRGMAGKSDMYNELHHNHMLSNTSTEMLALYSGLRIVHNLFRLTGVSKQVLNHVAPTVLLWPRMSDTDAHFENRSVQIARMDQLFEATFSPLASSGKPLSRCGQCRRYMRLIAARPTRLYCPTCEQVYNVPQVPRPPLSPHPSFPVASTTLLTAGHGGASGGIRIVSCSNLGLTAQSAGQHSNVSGVLAPASRTCRVRSASCPSSSPSCTFFPWSAAAPSGRRVHDPSTCLLPPKASRLRRR